MNTRAQGATEYLLLFGGAVLLVVIILLLLISYAPAASEPLQSGLDFYQGIDVSTSLGDNTGPPPVELEGDVSLENEDVSLVFSETPTEDVALDSITHLGGGSAFLMGGSSLWNVTMIAISPYGIVGVVSPETGGCDPVQYSSWKSGPTNILEWYWNHCPVTSSAPTDTIDFKLRIELDDGSTIARWKPSVVNHSPYGIHRVDLLLNIHPHTSNDIYLMPGADGQLIHDPVNTLPASSQSLHIEFTQVQAWYDPSQNEGLYIATLDPRNSRSKYTRRDNDGSSVLLTLGAFGEEPLTTNSFTVPYALALGTFSGDWYDAAQIYRGWVESQNVITSAGKLRSRGDVPTWYKELGLQLIQNYPIDSLDPLINPNAVGFFDSIKNYYLPCAEYHSSYPSNPAVCSGPAAQSDQILSLFQWNWYDQYYNGTTWEEPNPPITPTPIQGYGEYSMIDRIQPLISTLESHGIYTEAYTQPGIFSITGPEYSTIQSQTFKTSAGTTLTVPPHPTDPSVGAVMDPASQPWHDFFANNIRDNLVVLGGHGIYMDNPYANYGINFSSTIAPPHPKGKGGTHFYEGYRDMMMDTRNTARTVDPDFILFHEQGMEAYVGASDSFSNSGTNSPAPSGFTQANVENVPLMEVLYHDYQLFNSSNTNPDFTLGHYNAYQGPGNEDAYKQSIQANVALGYSFGRMVNSAEPGLAFNAPNHTIFSGSQTFLSYTDFLKLLIKVRKSAAKEYLIYGQLLRPLSSFGTSTTYTYLDVYGAGTPYSFSIPDVLSSVWKANDGSGSVGIVLINPTNTNQTVTVPFNPADYGKSSSSTYSELNLDNSTAHISQAVFNKPFSGFSAPITINARSVRVIRVD